LVVWRLDQRADVKVECSHFKRFKTTITLPPLEPDELVNRISSPKIENGRFCTTPSQLGKELAFAKSTQDCLIFDSKIFGIDSLIIWRDNYLVRTL
jgi:hypothetical protein